MFTTPGIKARVLLLSLLPTSLFALALGAYFIGLQHATVRRQLQANAQLLAQELAPQAALALQERDSQTLQRIAVLALEKPNVRAISFLDKERRSLVHAGPSMLADQPGVEGTRLTTTHTSRVSRLVLPIIRYRDLLFLPAEPTSDDQVLGWVDLEVSYDDALIGSYRTISISLLLIFVGLAITALMAVSLSRRINTPLERIKKGVTRLQKGHLETRLPEFGSAELDDLAQGFNRMAESLQEARLELELNVEQATGDLRQTLETVEIQNIELDRARKEALEAARIKSEFLAHVSHEIRTPMNGILGFLKLLRKTELDNRQRDYLNTVENSADNLLSIINDILDFSKLEAGKVVLERAPLNLAEILEETLDLLAPEAHKKQLELVNLIDNDVPLHLIGDPLRLKQVLTNLINNAIKFTSQGSVLARTTLESKDQDQACIRISVIDTGIGLSESESETLFRAFSQMNSALSRLVGGTGLGLSLSKRLIERMGGEIGVESAPGKGSNFWIRLTLPRIPQDSAPSPPPLQGHRVMLVEPHESARLALIRQLHDFGVRVLVLDGLEALIPTAEQAIARGQPFDLAILGVCRRNGSPDHIRQQVDHLAARHCVTLLLCPTTEYGDFLDSVPNGKTQLIAKPAGRAKLLSGLLALLPGAARPTPAHQSPRPPLRILCVDDNPSNLLLVQSLLSDLGASVTTADSGHGALQTLDKASFDLVFMDLQMPGMDGCQTTREIRAREVQRGTKPVPVVALSARQLEDDSDLLLSSGINDRLSKPINELQLAHTIAKWTSGLPKPGVIARGQPKEPDLDWKDLPVLDPEESLRLAAGKADLAADMLNMLLASLDEDRLIIAKARQSRDWTALRERVHRLHGASRYCGVPQLRETCRRCETLLKRRDPGVEAALDRLDLAIERLFQQAGRLLPV